MAHGFEPVSQDDYEQVRTVLVGTISDIIEMASRTKNGKTDLLRAAPQLPRSLPINAAAPGDAG